LLTLHGIRLLTLHGIRLLTLHGIRLLTLHGIPIRLTLHRVLLTLHGIGNWNTDLTAINHLHLLLIHLSRLAHRLSIGVHGWIPVFSLGVVIILFVVDNWHALSELRLRIRAILVSSTLFAQAATQDDADNDGGHATYDNTYDHPHNFHFLVVGSYALLVICLAELSFFVGGNRVIGFSRCG